MKQTPEQVAKAGSASFFHFHDGTWQGIALQRGMKPLEFVDGGPHEEGFSYSYTTFSWDTGEDDRTLSFVGLDTKADEDFGELKIAVWDVKSSLTHDYNAIAAGY